MALAESRSSEPVPPPPSPPFTSSPSSLGPLVVSLSTLVTGGGRIPPEEDPEDDTANKMKKQKAKRKITFKGHHVLYVIVNTGQKNLWIKFSPIRAGGENFLPAKISSYMVYLPGAGAIERIG